MTTRSRRRTAELAVIEAAREWRKAGRQLPLYALGRLEDALKKAVDDLAQVQVEADAKTYSPNGAPFTSAEAAEWMRRSGKATVVAVKVFAAIYRSYRGGGVGLTTDQLEHHLGGSHQSISPRVTDLRNKGLIKDSGVVRRTRTGRKAVVWTPTQTAIDAASQGGMPWNWTASLSSTTDGS